VPCYAPLSCYRSATAGKNGKHGVTWKRRESTGELVKLPCGQCFGCRLERSRQWAIRCVHEAQLHDDNCFITLTYNDHNLPAHGNLIKSDFQLFMKRLRFHYKPKKIRYYHCGEYGAELQRPHFHACLFGLDFLDKQLFRELNGQATFTSPTLEYLWPQGFALIGSVTFESAAYVARYIMKKINGEAADKHYESVSEQTGEVIKLNPEYTTMSLKPGIGHDWYQKYKTDVYPENFVVLKGKKMKPPRYYQQRYEIENPEAYKTLQKKNKAFAKEHKHDSTPERLAVRQKCKIAQINILPRSYENGT